MIKWIKWYFIESKKCSHKHYEWYMKDFGMSKIKICKICGKVLETI